MLVKNATEQTRQVSLVELLCVLLVYACSFALQRQNIQQGSHPQQNGLRLQRLFEETLYQDAINDTSFTILLKMLH